MEQKNPHSFLARWMKKCIFLTHFVQWCQLFYFPRYIITNDSWTGLRVSARLLCVCVCVNSSVWWLPQCQSVSLCKALKHIIILRTEETSGHQLNTWWLCIMWGLQMFQILGFRNYLDEICIEGHIDCSSPRIHFQAFLHLSLSEVHHYIDWQVKLTFFPLLTCYFC